MTPIQWIPWEDRKSTTRRGPHAMNGKLKRMPWVYCTHEPHSSGRANT